MLAYRRDKHRVAHPRSEVEERRDSRNVVSRLGREEDRRRLALASELLHGLGDRDRHGGQERRVPADDVHLKDGRLRLGGCAERAGLEVDWDARFNSDVFIGDEPVADFVTECGTTGIWTWRKYASGASECFGTTEEKTYSLASSYGTLRSSPSSAVNSEQYPRGLFSAAPSVTVTSARGSHAVLLAPRDAGRAGASPNYFVLYPSVPGIDSVSTAIHIAARGKYK